MEYKIRKYPLFSACGLNCGLCARYHTGGKSKCPGCAGEGFLQKHPVCGVLSCCRRHELEYCYLCDDFPSAAAVRIFQGIADKHGVSLQLRRKTRG